MSALLCNLAWFLLGIPFGFGCFKIAKVSFAPLGKKVVGK